MTTVTHKFRAIFLTTLLLGAARAGVVSQALPTDTVVKNVARPLHSGRATLVQEISIGMVEGAEEYLFGDVTEMAVAADGSIYVFDRQVPALRKYDANGKYVRTFGRKGQGPGEYLSGGGLAVLPDGRVLLWDTGTWRINVYSPNGESLNSIPTPSGLGSNSSLVTSRSLLVDTSGAVFVRRVLRDVRRLDLSRQVWLRMRNDGTVTDTIAVPDLGVVAPSISARTANSSSTANVPFAPRALTAFSPFGYFVTAFPSRYAFELRPPKAARPIVSIRRAAQPERVSAEERSAARTSIEEQMRRTDPGWSWNGPDIPRFKPYFENISVAADGRIWVAITQETVPRSRGGANIGGGGTGAGTPASRLGGSREPPKAGLYDVFEPNGTYIGQVALPLRLILNFRRGDYVWGVAYDEDDVATVKRYRVGWR